jgi:hypothetical protein
VITTSICDLRSFHPPKLPPCINRADLLRGLVFMFSRHVSNISRPKANGKCWMDDDNLLQEGE